MLETGAATPDESTTPVRFVGVSIWPTLPVAAALPFVTPTIFGVVMVGDAWAAYVDAAVAEVRYGESSVVKPAPLTVPLAASVVNEPELPLIGALDIVPPEMVGDEIVGLVPNTAGPLPVSSEITLASCTDVVGANCASVAVVSAPLVTHVKPVPDVDWSTLFAVLQLGTLTAVGVAVEPLKFASTELVAIAASVEFPHVAALDGPVETTTCPAVDPAVLNVEIGVNVVAKTANDSNNPKAPAKAFFKNSPLI